jgi:glycosyltransferase involved in cell wall biosynthesis
VNYLASIKADFRFVELPFSFAAMGAARMHTYRAGKLKETVAGHAAKGPDPVLWLRDFCMVVAQGLRLPQPAALFVGIDNLNALAGVVLKRLGKVQRVAYYVIDYTPRRFGNPLLNAVYHWVDRRAALGADVVWNLSERMREVRRKQGVAEERNQVVPVGVELHKVRHAPRSKVRTRTLLYMGALMKDKGIQLLIEAMPLIRKKVPSAKLVIMGAGPYEEELKRQIAASPAAGAIEFTGAVEHKKLLASMSYYGVAVAPYVGEENSYTYWCDPTKPKEYLACGLPLIMTRVPWLWEKVADKRKPMGIAVDYILELLAAAATRLLADQAFYWKCRKNALEFSRAFRWSDIYGQALAGLPRTGH